MSVYDLHGNTLRPIHDKTGNPLQSAYDINGNSIYSSSPGVDPNFTVMSFNPQWFTEVNSQLAMLQEIFETNNPDVIGFQEYTKTSSLPYVATQALTDYPYKYQSAVSTNPNGIATKTSFDSIQDVRYTYYDDEVWQYQKAILTFNSKRVAIYNTHLTWRNNSASEEGRRQQAAELFADAENEQYSIITGDFNSYCKSIHDTDYINIYKQFVDNGYNLSNCSPRIGFFGTYAGSYTTEEAILADGWPCDVIITSGNIGIVESYVDFTKLKYKDGYTNMDHMPVVAKLKI